MQELYQTMRTGGDDLALSTENSIFFTQNLPFWKKLNETQKKQLLDAALYQTFAKGTPLHSGSDDCSGLFLIKSGQIRIFILSENGKEITLYHLFERDICLFSASCMMKNIRFEVFVEAEKDTEVLLIPTKTYADLEKNCLALADYTNQLMSSRFSEVMWVMEQVLFMSFDKRLALFLLEQANLAGGNTLAITHEMIAKHLGSAREVVTRMLNYFQTEKMVFLSRGGIVITDEKKLQKILV